MQVLKSTNKRSNHRRATKRRKLRMEMLEARRVLAAITWDGASDGDGDNVDWHDAGNWDLDRRPTNGDDVFIPDVGGNMDTFVDLSRADAQINDLTIAPGARLSIINRTFYIQGQGIINGTLDLGEATETPSGSFSVIDTSGDQGELIVNGALNWNPHSLIKLKTTIAEPGTTTVRLVESHPSYHSGNVLFNFGTIVLTGAGRLNQQQGSTINNDGQFVLDGGTSVSSSHQGGGGDFYNHPGATLTKTGSEPAYFANNSASDNFDNNGLVIVEEGILVSSRTSISNGRFEIAAGATLLYSDHVASFGPDSAIVGAESDAGRARFYLTGARRLGSPKVGTANIQGIYDVPWTVLDGLSHFSAFAGSQVSLRDLDVISVDANFDTKVDLQVDGNVRLQAGAFTSDSNALITLTGNTEITPAAGVRPNWAGNFTNRGTMRWNGEGQIVSSVNLINEGTIVIDELPSVDGSLKLTNRGTITKEPNTGHTQIQTLSGGYFYNEGLLSVGENSSLFINNNHFSSIRQDGGELRVFGDFWFTNGPLEVYGGLITGAKVSAYGLRNFGGTLSPNGDEFGALSLGLDLFSYDDSIIAIDVGGNQTGVDADQITLYSSVDLDGTLVIDTTQGYVPNLGDSIEIIAKKGDSPTFSLTGAFDQIEGRLINATTAWELSQTATSVVLTAVAISESELAEIVRQEFNLGVSRTRERLPDWIDGGALSLPGYSQGLGSLFAAPLAAMAPSLLPNIDTPVASFDELKSQATALGYTVACSYVDIGCGELFDVSVANRSQTAPLSALSDLSFSELSAIPDGVDLRGTLDWEGTTTINQFGIGFGSDGFFVSDSAELSFEVTGGGDLTQDDFALSAGGLSLDFDASVSIDPTKPISATLSPKSRLAAGNFQTDPADIFDITSAGQSRLEIMHTIDPTELTYDGVWVIEQIRNGDQFEISEISSDVSYPDTNDWLASSIGVLGSVVQTIFGAQAAQNFNELSIPLIADATPADAAPGLVGINSADFDGPNKSWMDKVFGGIKTVFSLFDEDDPTTGGEGQFGTEGDVLTNANLLRFHRNVSGVGIKVGVISTGADGLEYATLSGDIPPSIPTLIDDDDSPFGGRGTAMLEVIHDIAPGADLSFAAATDEQSLFRAVTWLTEIQGVDVIVSDVNDYSETLFRRGAITRFIEDQIAKHDVVFVQAAGNDGERSYRDRLQFINRVIQPNTPARTLHQFGGTTADPVTTLPVTLPAHSVVRFVLQTDQPTVAPTAQIALQPLGLPSDVLLDRLGFSIENPAQRDRDVPLTVDSFSLANHSNDPVEIHLVVEMLAGQLPAGTAVDFQIVALGDVQLANAKGPSLFGAALAQQVLVVGAVEMDDTNQAAPYSSGGALGQRIPDLVGPAGIDTSGFGMRFYDDFHGSSSGAAHVAAIAALLKSVDGNANAARIRQAITSTAKPLGTGVGDLQSGFGLIDASAAAQDLVPITLPTDQPPSPGETGAFNFLSSLSQFSEIVLPSQQDFETLLAGGDILLSQLLQMRVTIDGDNAGTFRAEFPFLFDGIGGFDQFKISGRVGIDAAPDVTLTFGWDDNGWYIDADTAKLAVDLTGTGEARGVAFDVFGVGAGGTVNAKPSIDVSALDRADDGQIRQDDIDQLQSDLSGGDVSLVLPKLDSVDADVFGDVIFGFLDYVDIDPNLPNRPNGGDPFIIRGRAKLGLDFAQSQLAWTFGDFRLANPDIDDDDQVDYTLGALARNAIRYGEDLINSFELPDFVTGLLGDLGLAEPRREDPYERPRGMLPKELPDTPESDEANAAINGHIATALAAAGNDGSAVDQNALRDDIKDELNVWLAGASSSAEGEIASESLPILDRLEILQRDLTRPKVDLPDTPEDEFEISMNLALSSYQRWIAALEIADLTREDVADQATLEILENRLINGLRFAIQRAHVGAIELHLAGAPLDHQFDDQGNLTQRGVIDRAIEAVRWAQTAEFLGLATKDNGLSVLQALDELVIRVNVNRAELVFQDSENDGYIGPAGQLNLEVATDWQIKLPAGADVPDIDQLHTYPFSPPITDAGGKIQINSAGASNNNVIAGESLTPNFDSVTGLPIEGDILPITTGVADSLGVYRTSVRLGDGDTQAQVQIDVGLEGIPVANTTTNMILGRPSIELLAADINQDDSALRKENLFLRPGGDMAVQARIRRGNGPLADASLSFYLDGGGSLLQTEVATTTNIPRTSSEGVATIFYTATLFDFDEVATIGVSFYENGTLFTDTVELQPTRYPEFAGSLVSPLSGTPNSADADAEALRTAFEALNEIDYDQAAADLQANLDALVTSREFTVNAKATAALALSENIDAQPDQAIEAVSEAGAAYFEWLAFAQLAEHPRSATTESVLLDAMENVARYFLDQFDGSWQNGGLTPLYDALNWGIGVETILGLQPGLFDEDTLTSEEILGQSGVEIEFTQFIDPAGGVIPGNPSLFGDTDDAQLRVAARVVKHDFINGLDVIIPVQQLDGVAAPVEVRVLPEGTADVTLDIPVEQQPAASNRVAWMQSQLRYNPDSLTNETIDPYSLVSAPSSLTGRASRGPSDSQLSVNVALGIPGLILETQVAVLRDRAKLDLRGALQTEDDASLRDSLSIRSTDRAVLQAKLTRSGRPIEGDLSFTLIGRGELSETTGSTGRLGVFGGIQFTPPVAPAGTSETHGTSLVSVRTVIDGKVSTDYLTIRYEFRTLGTDGDVIGTPDFARASDELADALQSNSVFDDESNVIDLSAAPFESAATEIMRDWFSIDGSDANGEGSVLFWLQQVQSTADGGVYPIDTTWKEVVSERDEAFRDALNLAFENWLRWQQMINQLNLPSDIAGADNIALGNQLIVGALRHAIDRVHARCGARANDYLATATDELLARLIDEGDQALLDISRLQELDLFPGITLPTDIDFNDTLRQFCYAVEFVEEETYLSGRPESARVRVKAGIRVPGVSELILPPATRPLVVNVQPVGNATLNGLGLGRTDANGVYDRVRASVGSSDGLLAVDVSVVFNFDNLNDPSAKRRASTLQFATKRLALDPTVNSTLRWTPSVQGAETLRAQSNSLPEKTRLLVDGESALVELRLNKGRAPLVGKLANVTLLGEGNVGTGSHVTDASGRIRFFYQPPPDKVGRARISVSYSVDGEVKTDAVTIDYTTTKEDVTTLDSVYSRAHSTAITEAGLLLAQVGIQNLLGNEVLVDRDQLETIQRTWLDSGINPNGTVDPSQDCGVRCAITNGQNASQDTRPTLTRRAIAEYLRWKQTTDGLGIQDRFNTAEDQAVLESLGTLAKSAIDGLVTVSLNERSAQKAQDAMRLAGEATIAGLLTVAEEDQYDTGAVRQRLGYEVRVDEARLHGEADNAWVQIVTRVYLSDPANPQGDKQRAATDTPIKLEVVPEGFQLINASQTVKQGVYGAKASIISGDTDLRLIIRASDSFGSSQVVSISEPGKSTLTAAARNDADTTAELSGKLALFSGQKARIEGIVTKGLGRVGFRDVLFSVDGAPVGSVERVPEESDKFIFTPPAGQSGTAIVTLSLQADGMVHQSSVEITFSDQAAPEGESAGGESATTLPAGGLLNSQHTVAAFNDVNIPLAGASEDAKLGNAFGLDSFQFPFSGGLPNAGEARNDIGNWFNNSFDLLHIADMETLVGFLNGLPGEPEEIIRVKLDFQKAIDSASNTILAADFSGLLPDGFEGSVSLDRPEFGGQVVFGIDTSSSPFYVLTKPDRLLTKQSTFNNFLNGGAEKARIAGRQATELTAKFGVGASFRSGIDANTDNDLIDGILDVPFAEGYLSSKLKVDFSDVAQDTGKLRFNNLSELANLKVGFDGSAIDTFQAIVAAEVTLPDLSDVNGNDNPLANLQVVGAIHNPSLDTVGIAAEDAVASDTPWQFQLRTGQLFQLDPSIAAKLPTDTLATKDDVHEPNDDALKIRTGQLANLGRLSDRVTYADLALNDAADWYRFETTTVGNASSFVRVDFAANRGDLDLGLYRLQGDELFHVRTDGLGFGGVSQVTLLGQPAGTYFVKVFDDVGGLQPNYALTIDPPGRLDPGIEIQIGDYRIVDTSLEINVDSNLEFVGSLDGRMAMTFAQQEDPAQTIVPVELGFRATIDTVVGDMNDNGGLHAELTTGIGGDSINVLRLRDDGGNEIPPPRLGSWAAEIDSNLGGYLIFDYVSATNFKFAGLDATNSRWVMGQYDINEGWLVDDNPASRAVANLPADTTTRIELIIDGTTASLWIEQGSTLRKVVVKDFGGNLEGRLGVGTPDGAATFDNVTLRADKGSDARNGIAGLPDFRRTLFGDAFGSAIGEHWELQKGVWSINDEDRFEGRGTTLQLGEWLLVENAQLRAYIDVQFNDTNILIPPPLSVNACDTSAGPEGCVSVGIELSDVDALLFQVDENQDGTRLFEDDADSQKGLLAINDGFLTIEPSGVRLGAGQARAVLQDVLHIDVSGAEINLTDDPTMPLLATSDIGIRIPALSDSDNLISINGATPGERLFGLSRPLDDSIPEFLLFQDTVTIDFNTELIQDKIDVGGVFPFSLDRVGIRFNDAGNTSGQVSNLADFDLLVAGKIDFSDSIFDALPFDPIFAIGQPAFTPPTGNSRRLSSSNAYQDACGNSIDVIQFPGFPPLCQNGSISAELHLAALLGTQPNFLLRNLGPIYVGFQDLSLFGSGDPIEDPSDAVNGGLILNGLLKLGGFADGKFVPDIKGSLTVKGKGNAGDPPDGTPLGSLTVAGKFLGPELVNDFGTADTSDDEYTQKLELNWNGAASGTIGSRFNVSIDQAAVSIKTIFTNTYTETEPFSLSVEIIPQSIDTGNLCIDLGNYVELCGSGFLNFDAGDNEPFAIIRDGSLELGQELGPLAGTSISAGGFGIGRDGTLYVIPAGFQVIDSQNPTIVLASFPDGAYIEVANEDYSGGLFGLPEWVPIEVRKMGLQFIGVADPDDPNAPNQPLVVGPPTSDEIKAIGGDAPRGVMALGNRLVNQVIPITDPDNLRLVISGGLEGNEMFPVTGNFERLQVHLGKLAGCVAIAIQNQSVGGVDGAAIVESFPGHIFDSACEFPIEGLNGLTIGLEAVDIGPLSVGGTLGLGVFTFDRPIDPDDPTQGTEQQNVFYGKLSGQLAVSDTGLGYEVVLTQYGFVLGRLLAGVPIPISTIVGSLGGPVGAALGAGAGFWLTGLQGGIVFDADPLPIINEPTDIFSSSKIRTPLKVTTADIANAVRDLAFENPTFSELIAAATDPDNLPVFGANQPLDKVFVDILSGRIPGIPVKFTHDDGFRIAISGTLTNQYVGGQLGLGVTLGLNVGYNFDTLRFDKDGNPLTELPNPLPPDYPVHPNGAPAMDLDGNALDADGNLLDTDGNPFAENISSAIATFNDLFGFQLYGFADVEVFGFKLVGAGILLDFTEPFNPVFNIAASLPAAPSLLSLILPAQGVIGAQLDFDGYIEGTILSTLVFLEKFQNDSLSFFGRALESLDGNIIAGLDSPLEKLANLLEADRRAAIGMDLSDETDPDYDPTLDPQRSGYDPTDENQNPTPDLWIAVVDVDGDGSVSATERQQPITREWLISRILGRTDVTPPIPKILPDPTTTSLGQLDLGGLVRISSTFMRELILVGPTLLADSAAAEALTMNIPFWPAIEAQMLAIHKGLLVNVDDPEIRKALNEGYELSLNQARVTAAFSFEIAETAFSAADGLAQKFAEVINPQLRVTGQLSPMFLGIPMGPPSQSVDITVNKHELTVNGTFSALSHMLNMSGIPAFVADRTIIDVHFPFENFLRDVYRLDLPKIDPLGDDWRIGLESSMSVLGLEIQNQTGLIFPAGAHQLFDERVQVYDPDPMAPDNPVTLEADKILVRNDHRDLMLAEGGLLYDGRLTLPRFLTDPVGLWTDLQADDEFRQQFENVFSDCGDIWACMTEHPIETFGLLSRVPELIGDASSLEEVSQVQLFVPNFIDDIIDSFDAETMARLDELTSDLANNGDALTEFVQSEVAKAISAGGHRLQDAYLIGSYGQHPAPFSTEPFDSVIERTDSSDPTPFPTTSKILGIELGSGLFSGKVTDNGFDIDLIGRFLGLADVRFEANLNTAYDPALLRVGAEFVLGRAPDECDTSVSPWQGATDAAEVASQLGAFLAHMGWSDQIDTVNQTIGDAYDWLDLERFSATGGLCVRAFSPGFDQNAGSDLLRKTGGIEAHAEVAIENLLEGDFLFQITPSAQFPLVPNVVAKASADQLLLPGLDGLTPSLDETATLRSSLEMTFEQIDGNLSSSLGGSITILGKTFAVNSSQSLEIHSDGISGSMSLNKTGPIGGGGSLFEIDGVFTLEFDTRTASGAILVENGSVRLPGFELSDASFEMRVDSSGVHFTNVNGHSELFVAATIDFSGGFSISPQLVPSNIDLAASLDIDIDFNSGLGFGPGDVHGGVSIVVDADGIHGAAADADPPGFFGYGTVFGVEYGNETMPAIRGTFDFGGCLSLVSPIVAEFELPGTGAACGAAHAVTTAITVLDVASVVEGDQGEFTAITVEVQITTFGTSNDFKIEVPWTVSPSSGLRISGPTSFFIDQGTTTHTIQFEVVGDNEFGEDREYTISIDEAAIRLDSGTADWYIVDGATNLIVRNDDELDLSPLDPPSNTVLYFDFDGEATLDGLRIGTFFDRFSQQTTSAPLAENFETVLLAKAPGATVRSASGLPVFVDRFDDFNTSTFQGAVKQVPGQAAKAVQNSSNATAGIEFTVDPKQGSWLFQGIDFFTPADAPQDWALYWDLEDFHTPILTSNETGALTGTYPELAPNWIRHNNLKGSGLPNSRVPISLGNDLALLCSERPITFRLTSPSDVPLVVDNLAVLGTYSPHRCASQMFLEESQAEIESVLNQLDDRLPGPVEIGGSGDVSLYLTDLGDASPGPYDGLLFDVIGSSSADTTIRIVGPSGGPPPTNRLVNVDIRTDGGARAVNLFGASTFRGDVQIAGHVPDGVAFNSLADHSSIAILNDVGQSVNFTSLGSLGDDVELTTTGAIGNLNLAGGWQSGRLVADSIGQSIVRGDFAARAEIQRGVQAFQVIGGDFNSPSYATGLATGQGNGPLGLLTVTSVSGVGGDLFGSLMIDGDAPKVSTVGGSINATIVATGSLTLQATYDATYQQGGNIAGNVTAASIPIAQSFGGTLSATLNSLDPSATAATLGAFPLAGQGGIIDSPNSFHFAGGIQTIIGNQINLRVEAGGRIGQIIAVDDGEDRPASLTGRFTAHTFGRIETDVNGSANFELAATAEAWQLDGGSAWDTILVQPGSTWLEDQVTLQPGVRPGDVRFHGGVTTIEINGTNDFDDIRLTWDEATGLATGRLNGTIAETFSIDGVDLVRIDALEGSDWIYVSRDFPLPILIEGGAGDDLIYSGAGSDTINGGPGRDTIFARAGNDVIDGGLDNDLISGADGDDLILTGEGHDLAFGGIGNDTIEGAAGRDVLSGGPGNDVLDGGQDRNRLYGGEGNDLMLGGDVSDLLYGGTGDDNMRAGAGNDVAQGGPGNDSIWGGSGNDRLFGNAGDDELLGNEGDDHLFGRAGNDVLRGGPGNDFARGGFGNDLLEGQEGDDHLQGNWGDDQLVGGPGNDLLVGGPGDDELYQDSADTAGEAEAVPAARVIARDINGDGKITPLDALLIINRLALQSSGSIAIDIENDQRYDANGDDQVSPIDALFVINHLAIAASVSTEPMSLAETLDRMADEVSETTVEESDAIIDDTANELAFALLSEDPPQQVLLDQLFAELATFVER